MRVLELAADDVGLVVGGDHEADRWQAIAALDGPRPAHAHDQREQQGIAHIDVNENRQ